MSSASLDIISHSTVRRVTSVLELQREIFQYLPQSSLYACSLTCHAWTSLALDYLWRVMYSAIDLFYPLGMCKCARKGDCEQHGNEHV
jgi:hypothetical protein